jgi:transcriptional regulator with XRE-family HTH domain
MKLSNSAKKSKIDLYVIQKVKDKRLAVKLSQADLAYELKVSSGFIGMAESPKYSTRYNIQHLNKLAEIFECSPQEFLPPTPLKDQKA